MEALLVTLTCILVVAAHVCLLTGFLDLTQGAPQPDSKAWLADLVTSGGAMSLMVNAIRNFSRRRWGRRTFLLGVLFGSLALVTGKLVRVARDDSLAASSPAQTAPPSGEPVPIRTPMP